MRILILFFIGLIAREATSQNLYEEAKRNVISDRVNNVDLKKMKLVSDGDALYVVDFSGAVDNQKIIYTKFDTEINFLDSVELEIEDSHLVRKFKKHRPLDFILKNDSAYLLFNDEVFIFPPNSDQILSVKLPSDASKLLIANNSILLCQNDRANGSTGDEIGKFWIFDEGRFIELYNFDVPHRYLLHFQNRNYYEVFHDGILFLSASDPVLSYLDLSRNELSRIEFLPIETWYKVSDEKREQYNRLADKDPNALFTAINDDLEKKISHNVRIDQVDSTVYLINYFPGKLISNDSFDWHQLLITLNGDFEIVDKKEFRHESSRAYIADRINNQLDFNFHDHVEDTFCFIDGVRYQLTIEPRADWSDRDLSRIEKEQNQSLLIDHYDLCIYSAKVR